MHFLVYTSDCLLVVHWASARHRGLGTLLGPRPISTMPFECHTHFTAGNNDDNNEEFIQSWIQNNIVNSKNGVTNSYQPFAETIC